MTAHRDFKRIIRSRQRKTGESYAVARVHAVRERAARLGIGAETLGQSNREGAEPLHADAVVLNVNSRSAPACSEGTPR